MSIASNIRTTSISGAGDQPFLEIELNAPTAIGAIDLTDAKLTGDFLNNIIGALVSTDGVRFNPYGNPVSIGGDPASRRISGPPGEPVTVSHIRLQVLDAARASGQEISIESVSLFEEDGLADAVLHHFTFDDIAAYLMVFGDKSAEIYRDGVHTASVFAPYNDSLLARLDFAQQLDTLITFHEAVPPWRVFRQGNDQTWDSRAISFETMRQHQFEGTIYTNGINEVQQLQFEGMRDDDTFNIQFDGETTTAISYSRTPSVLARNIENGLLSLSFLNSGDVDVSSESRDNARIEFTAEAGQANQPEMGPSIIASEEGVVRASTLRQGEEGGEDIISEQRGWPRTGLFAQGRLFMGGLRDLPQTCIASALGEYFSFDAGRNRATDALEFTIDADDANGIRRMFFDRYLVLLTASNEFYVEADTFAADETQPVIPVSRFGIQFNVPPLSVDGSLIYVQRGGRIIRELAYADDARSFLSTYISVRAPTLIDRPIRGMSRPPGLDFEDSLYQLVMMEGEVVNFTSLREQDVSAWSREDTDGKFIASGADTLGRVYAVIERVIDGEKKRYVEVYDPSRVLDSSILVSVENQQRVDGLDHLEGKEVYLTDGSEWFGPILVEAGAIVMDQPLTGRFEVGLWFDGWLEILDIRLQTPQGSIINKRRKVRTVEVSLLESASPRISIFGKTFPFPVRPKGESALSGSPLSNLITGILRMEGFTGWDRQANFRIERAAPAPLHIRAINTEVDY